MSNLGSLKELLNTEDKLYCVAARVALHDGESTHYEVTDQGAMMVSVRTHRSDVQIWALMKGGGYWRIPPIDAEVMLCFDDGEFEGDAYLVQTHEWAPQGLTPGKTLVLDDLIEARSEEGTAQALALLQDLAQLKSTITAWTPVPNDGGAALKAALMTLFNTWPTGTRVLKGE